MEVISNDGQHLVLVELELNVLINKFNLKILENHKKLIISNDLFNEIKTIMNSFSYLNNIIELLTKYINETQQILFFRLNIKGHNNIFTGDNIFEKPVICTANLSNITDNTLVTKEYCDQKYSDITPSDIYQLSQIITSNTDLTTSMIYQINTTNNSVTLVLPAITSTKLKFTIADISGKADINNIIIQTSAGNYIYGQQNLILSQKFNSITIVSNLIDTWIII